VLAAAGVGSARADAEQLAAHVADVDRGRLFLTDPDDDFYPRFRDLVDARARRIPLQHLIGSAAFGPVTLGVGPGVFVPRPETESLLEWALAQPLPDRPVIVDLCTGSGALAVALARALPTATVVVAVDDSPEALAYARRNVVGTGVELVEADVTADGLLAGRDGAVDLIVANPPYIPDGAELQSEVADHDPHHALFGGPDGMAVIEPIGRTPSGCWAAVGGWASNTTTPPPPRRPRCSTAAGPSPTSRPGAIWPDGHASSPRRGPGEKLGPT
jgi:release factor glutamine methyltransferase